MEFDNAAYAKAEEKARQEINAAKQAFNAGNDARACREYTVGEMLDTHIASAERHLKALHDLKGCLPGHVLTSGASRFASLIRF